MYTLFIILIGYQSMTSQVIPGFINPQQCIKEAKALESRFKKMTIATYCVKVK